MATIDRLITDDYAIYNADCVEVMRDLPDASVHLSIHSPPFAKDNGGALYHYSSSPRDLSNARSYGEFFTHYGFAVRELARMTMAGRMAVVHCTDVPSGNTGCDSLADFPGDLIKLYQGHGFEYAGRIVVWKEPLGVRNRLMTKSLAHKSIVDDSSRCSIANADYLLLMRRKGTNPVPITHEHGLLEYAGSDEIPAEILPFKGWKGSQLENRFSQWVWRHYASSVWLDVRIDEVLPFRDAKEPDDEKHVHPLQLDVIERCLQLWSNPGETVFTPCMGVGSEVYGAVRAGRKGIGVELKAAYFRQAVLNLASVKVERPVGRQPSLFDAPALEAPAAATAEPTKRKRAPRAA